MSRISRYQESISRFVKTKSYFSELIKSNKSIENIIDECDNEASIVLLTILNGQNKKSEMKMHHGYYMAAGIDFIMMCNVINDNTQYYEEKCGKQTIKTLLCQMSIYVNECLRQNVETLENFLEKDKIFKIQKNINSYVCSKLLELTKDEVITGSENVDKTDIINYKFNDKNIINNKYKKMKMVKRDILMAYINRTYGCTCQCAFVLGWLLGLGDSKMINNLERLGTHLGILIKLSNDFKNLERDINTGNKTSLNFVVNYGIHECFDLFSESKVKLIEGCLTLNIYNITIKEVIDYIESKFDKYLNNTDLEMESKYSSFSTASN